MADQRPAEQLPRSLGLTVSRIAAEFWDYAERYYVGRGGKPSREGGHFQAAMCSLRRLYGGTQAAAFGPLALKVIQREMIKLGWCRKYVNCQLGRIKQIFRWAVSQELAPATISHGLASVEGLREGKTEARETGPIKAVAEEHVEATLAHVSRQVAAMARLAQL